MTIVFEWPGHLENIVIEFCVFNYGKDWPKVGICPKKVVCFVYACLCVPVKVAAVYKNSPRVLGYAITREAAPPSKPQWVGKTHLESVAPMGFG